MKRKGSKGPKKKRRGLGTAFSPVDPSPVGNYEQRRLWNALRRQRMKKLRRAAAREIKGMSPEMRKLIKGTDELNRAIEKKGDA